MHTTTDLGKPLILRLSTNFEESYLRDYSELVKTVSKYFVWDLMVCVQQGAGWQVHRILAVSPSDLCRFTVHARDLGGRLAVRCWVGEDAGQPVRGPVCAMAWAHGALEQKNRSAAK